MEAERPDGGYGHGSDWVPTNGEYQNRSDSRCILETEVTEVSFDGLNVG